MKLKLLTLTNFKGLKAVHFDLDGKSSSIYGSNGSGKTTLYDAFLWLLFGKDSLGRKDFSVKPIGSPKGIEVAVEGIFELNGKELKLKKTLKENWVTQKGSLEAELKGNETNCYIDEVPTAPTKYKQYISGICEEDVFKLLTNPNTFSQQLKWQERRQLLFEVCGDQSDAHVIETNKELQALIDLLGGHSVSDYKKILVERRKKINNELNLLPTRIDEAYKQVMAVDAEKAKQNIIVLTQQLNKFMAEISRLESGIDTASLEKKRDDVKQQVEMLQFENEKYRQQQKSDFFDVVREKQMSLDEILHGLGIKNDQLKLKIQKIDLQIDNFKKTKIQYQQDYQRLQEKESLIETVCPSCGQDIPQEAILQAQQLISAQRIDLIEKGKRNQKCIEDLVKEKSACKQEREEFEQRIAKISTALIKIASNAPVILNLEHYVDQKLSLEQEIQELEVRISTEKNNLVSKLTNAKNAYNQVCLNIEAQNEVVLQDKTNNMILDRIKGYSIQQKNYASQLEETDYGLYLCDLFTQQKVKLITENINSKFSLARFKLFDTQINGGIADCCEVTVENVPYSDLNSAMRINIGLDIIATLQKYYHFYPPIWVDNSETINQIQTIDTQMIELCNPAKFENLPTAMIQDYLIKYGDVQTAKRKYYDEYSALSIRNLI